MATSRYGITNDPPSVWTNGIENWQESNNALQNPQWYSVNPNDPGTITGSLGEMVYRLFAPGYFTLWESFATTLYHKNDSTDYRSLEYIHNNIQVGSIIEHSSNVLSIWISNIPIHSNVPPSTVLKEMEIIASSIEPSSN